MNKLTIAIGAISLLPYLSGTAQADDKHPVKAGDSIASIADFYGVSQNDLREANRLKQDDIIRPGQELTIPDSLRGGAVRHHVIEKGDTLSSIAKKHRVPAKTLASANKLTKSSPLQLGRTLVIPDRDDALSSNFHPKKVTKLIKSGKKVQGGVAHTVQPGQSLWIIARAYNTSGDRIAAANNFSPEDRISVGQTILIPGASTVVPVRVKGFVPQPTRLVSVWNNDNAVIRLLSNSGKVNQKSRKILSRLGRAKTKKNRIKLLHPRLVHMLQRVAERFPGKTIEIISGYRPHKRGTRVSKHSEGRALDFRVEGVPNRELYEFIKELPGVGAGYYPNSVFVHMDVRNRKILWTDYSGVGQAAQYEKPTAPSQESDIEAASDAVESETPEERAGQKHSTAKTDIHSNNTPSDLNLLNSADEPNLEL